MANDLLVEMAGIDKHFAGVVALAGASLTIAPGEVCGLIGQNGAGKSTLIKVLTGVYPRDDGSVSFAGAPLTAATPREAQEAGIATIHQELNLVPMRSVTENIVMGYEPRRFGLINWGEAHRRAREILARFDVRIDVRRPLDSFSTAIQQLVAIARAVSLDARLVIMDEPTSSLDDKEVEVLFSVVRSLREQGVAVLYVTHFLDELFEVCDSVTVMRDGQTVERVAIGGTSKVNLIAAMLGRPVDEIAAEGLTELGGGETHAGEELIRATAIASGRNLRHVDLSLRRGEIVGLGGLLGSGRTEAARAIFGVDPLTGGDIRVKGGKGPGAPTEAIAAGIGLLSEDRKAEGIVPDMSVRENLTLALLPRLTRRGSIRRGEERAIVARFITALGIKAAHMDQPIRELSGGNQQKVLLARWLAIEPDVLILDEPTRGIDVGAKREVQRIVREFVDGGNGVILISSEFEELVEGADTVVVLRDGRSITTLSRPGITEDGLISAIAHHDDAAPEVPA
ncbi:MAG: sugar ABC transporter ATP-binding protein [Pseudomonadota bacterium]